MKKPEEVTLEKEFARLQADIDIDTWENKRGPRPWEQPEKVSSSS